MPLVVSAKSGFVGTDEMLQRLQVYIRCCDRFKMIGRWGILL